MPTTTLNPTVELLDFEDLLEYAANNLDYSGQTELLEHISAELRSNPYRVGGLTTKEAWANEIQKKLAQAGYEVTYNGNGAWTGSVFSTKPTVTTMPNPIDSNVSTVSRGWLRNKYGGLNEFGTVGQQTWVPTRFPVSGGLGSKALYLVGSVSSGISAASTGIWLGKTFDSALYNALPNVWDSIGMSSLNPETWNDCTNGDDSPFAGLFNFILGLDPDTGKAEAYMNEEALAYMAYYMKTQGVFNPSMPSATNESLVTNPELYRYPDYWNQPIQFYDNQYSETVYNINDGTVYRSYNYIASGTSPVYIVRLLGNGDPQYNRGPFFVSSASFTVSATREDGASQQINSSRATTRGGEQFYYAVPNIIVPTNMFGTAYVSDAVFNNVNATLQSYTVAHVANDLYELIVNGVRSEGVSIEGIGNQDGATLPNVSDWNDIPSTLQSLQNQYHDSFANPMIWNNDSPYDDTTGNMLRYIPVPFPAVDANGNPVSDTQNQTSTEISPQTTTQNILDYLMKVMQQTATDTSPADTTPPQNPTDTGTGDSPTPVSPSGSASALWSVYHPTQAQVNSFGGWLWGSVFTTDIRKLFTDPIQGVISLHKIFAPPVDSGNGTIVVGTLDSNVPSATVTQQYVTVDCGSIDCYEEFGNVFDYEPYTQVYCYLPFIGIVPLKTDDVMRSTIHITYGVDVFTGACLAMIEVSRDGNTVNMYQYSGVASVEYPLTNLQQSNIISGLLSVAGGVAMAVGSGGVGFAAGAAMIGGAASAAKTSVGRSGGFSGNAGAMGIKTPYLIIERPQTKVAETFPALAGYPTNYSCRLNECSGHVTVKHVHLEGINATDSELSKIDSLLRSGVIV